MSGDGRNLTVQVVYNGLLGSNDTHRQTIKARRLRKGFVRA